MTGDTPGKTIDTIENQNRIKTADFDDQLHLITKKSHDENSKKAFSTIQSKSQLSPGRSSNRKISDPAKLNQTNKIKQDIREFRLSFFKKLVEVFFTTSIHRELRNLIELFSSIIAKSKSREDLTSYVDDILYSPNFQDRLFPMLFKHKSEEKFEKVGRFLIVLIDHYENYSRQKNNKESCAYLSSSFYRFINDCIEPLIQVISEVV